jgi:hypothetical protein
MVFELVDLIKSEHETGRKDLVKHGREMEIYFPIYPLSLMKMI